MSWLIQVAIDPALLHRALEVFPCSLNQDSTVWKKYESVAPEVGVICNMFHSNPYYWVDFDQQIRETLTLVTNGDCSNFYSLLHCRIKLFLTSYVYKSGNVGKKLHSYSGLNPEEFGLTDTELVHNATNMIFDTNKNIFVVASDEYRLASSVTKKCNFVPSNFNSIVVNEFPNLKVFDISTMWKNTYIEEIEKVISCKLTQDQIDACTKFVTRYIEVMPLLVKDTCNEI